MNYLFSTLFIFDLSFAFLASILIDVRTSLLDLNDQAWLNSLYEIADKVFLMDGFLRPYVFFACALYIIARVFSHKRVLRFPRGGFLLLFRTFILLTAVVCILDFGFLMEYLQFMPIMPHVKFLYDVSENQDRYFYVSLAVTGLSLFIFHAYSASRLGIQDVSFKMPIAKDASEQGFFYEAFVKKALEKQGFLVIHHGKVMGSGDGGVDLMAYRPGSKTLWLIQCKYYIATQIDYNTLHAISSKVESFKRQVNQRIEPYIKGLDSDNNCNPGLSLINKTQSVLICSKKTRFSYGAQKQLKEFEGSNILSVRRFG